jgi:hypothetical protein
MSPKITATLKNGPSPGFAFRFLSQFMTLGCVQSRLAPDSSAPEEHGVYHMETPILSGTAFTSSSLDWGIRNYSTTRAIIYRGNIEVRLHCKVDTSKYINRQFSPVDKYLLHDCL